MPSDGVELSPKDHILTDEEIIRLATLFVRHGVNKIRLTGGEPTVRKGITELVCELYQCCFALLYFLMHGIIPGLIFSRTQRAAPFGIEVYRDDVQRDRPPSEIDRPRGSRPHPLEPQS